MIRILITDDSATCRTLLGAILGAEPGFEVVGMARDGLEAVEMNRELRPDVVTMDLHMPRLGGLEATREIMIDAPTPIILVSGDAGVGDVGLSLRALEAGALDVLRKPPAAGSKEYPESARRLRATVRAMAGVKVVRRFRGRPAAVPTAAIPARPGPCRRPAAVAIAASTGGPAALHRLLSGLPAGFPAPILIVQHIARGFASGLASWLGDASGVRVKLASAGEPMLPGVAYLAPDDRHLVAGGRGLVALSDGPAIGGFRPSANALFESVASAWGPSATAVILTGMGEDGVAGLRAVRRAGGRVIAQDEASSVVFGMPGAAVAAGLADAVLPLGEIAGRLSRFD